MEVGSPDPVAEYFALLGVNPEAVGPGVHVVLEYALGEADMALRAVLLAAVDSIAGVAATGTPDLRAELEDRLWQLLEFLDAGEVGMASIASGWIMRRCEQARAPLHLSSPLAGPAEGPGRPPIDDDPWLARVQQAKREPGLRNGQTFTAYRDTLAREAHAEGLGASPDANVKRWKRKSAELNKARRANA